MFLPILLTFHKYMVLDLFYQSDMHFLGVQVKDIQKQHRFTMCHCRIA